MANRVRHRYVTSQVEAYRELLPDTADRIPSRYREMPYRTLLSLMWERLGRTMDDGDQRYDGPDELLDDLDLIAGMIGESWDSWRLNVERALELEPAEPAILDSMGWVEYRLGNIKSAEDYLRRALELRNDPEIAAHLEEITVDVATVTLVGGVGAASLAQDDAETMQTVSREAAVFEGQAVGQCLGDRLDRERLPGVADLVDMAVDGDQGDAQPGRQLGQRAVGQPGAGFDLVALHFTDGNEAKVFELDQANTLNIKVETLKQAGIGHDWIPRVGDASMTASIGRNATASRVTCRAAAGRVRIRNVCVRRSACGRGRGGCRPAARRCTWPGSFASTAA